MGYGKNKVTAAGGLALVLAAACMAVAAAADNKQPQDAVPKEMVNFCPATGCMGGGNITAAKELIGEVFDAAVAEIEIAIKNSSVYKKLETDVMTKRALDVCERVLANGIGELRYSFDHIKSFKVGQVNRVLDEVKIWVSGAITCKDTCHDAFSKTRGKSGRVVRQMLQASGALLDKSLRMVIEFQESFQTAAKKLEGLVDSITSHRQLLDGDAGDGGIPDFVSDHTRKLIESPTRNELTTPNVVVAQDGSGDYKTINEAVAKIPVKSQTPYVIRVKKGLYLEYVTIPKGADNVVMIGDGPTETIISGNKCYTKGFPTFDQATLIVEGRSFMAKDMTVENTAGPEGDQAVAVRATGDMGVFFNVHMDSYQDTLYAHYDRQLYRNCRIRGTIDFIFGNSVAVLQNCDLVVRKPLPKQKNMVTAQGRTGADQTGITIIHGCRITGEDDLLAAQPPFYSYLGRPWKIYSRTVIMQTDIGGFIDPEGWAPWEPNTGTDLLFYVEYKNQGDGSGLARRADWNGIQNKGESQQTLKIKDDDAARPWTPLAHFKTDEWIYNAGVPFSPEFYVN